jgi:hypothetical protein
VVLDAPNNRLVEITGVVAPEAEPLALLRGRDLKLCDRF